jgi:flagellar protein FliS
MSTYHAGQYREIEVKTATPTELVVLLYDGAIAGLREARSHLQAGDIANRARCINKVTAILTELQANLNFEVGGEIAHSLDRLYTYIRDRIFQANAKQDETPLLEAIKLMDDLRSAWVEVARSEGATNKPASAANKAAPAALGVGAGESPSIPSVNVTA